MVAGLKAKFLRVIVSAGPDGIGVVPAGCVGPWLEVQPGERQASISRIAHARGSRIPEYLGIR